MGRFIALLYGLVCYAVFSFTMLYAVGFVSGVVVPKTIDTGTVVPMAEASVINLFLIFIFAIQHSVTARKQFKQWLAQSIPAAVERSTFVLLASLTLGFLFWQWHPMPARVWQIADPRIAMAVTGLSVFGWMLTRSSTFLISHFELFGLHQVANHLTGREAPAQRFRAPVFYKVVRHPIYLGFLIAVWVTPTMTVGHLQFAATMTAYIFVGILFGRAGSGRSLRRRLSPLQRPCVDAGALAQIDLKEARHDDSAVGSARLCRMDVGTQQILIIVTRSRAIGTNGKEAHDLKATITFRVP